MSDLQEGVVVQQEGERQQAECDQKLRGDLVEDLRQVQEAIQQHKSDLTGVPEALRSEAQQLRDELSQMELFSRLGELKEQLAEASESAPREANADGTNTEATTALVCEAEDTELDIQLQQLFQAVEVAKQSRMDLETEKMRLQKEMLELQLLLNADDQAACDKLDDGEVYASDEDAGSSSPRIPAVKEFELVELDSMNNSEQAGVL